MEEQYKDFEEALSRLEGIVGQLEEGELPLEQALKLFEEGMRISTFCGKKLEEAERKVAILLKDQSGELAAQPFPEEES